MSRRFAHVFEQFGYVVEPDARFRFGEGWEQILRSALTKLSAVSGPPRVSGGKEKGGCLVLHVAHDPAQREAVEAIRADLRKRSLTVCEECGKAGRLRMGIAQFKTTCEDHAHLVGPLRDDDGTIGDPFA